MVKIGGREFQGFTRYPDGYGIDDFQGPSQFGREHPQTWPGLTQIPTVYACINKIVGALGSYPRRVLDATGKPVPSKPLWIEDPNALMSGVDLVSATAISLLLDGNAYIFHTRGQSGRVMTVGIANPNVVNHYLEGDKVVWYINGTRMTTEFTHIRHITLPGRLEGLAKKVPLKRVADISVESLKYTQVHLQRGMALQIAIKGTHKLTANKQGRQSIKQMLKDYHSGYRNAYNPLILLPGLDVEVLNMKEVNADGGFLDLQKATDIQICTAFGVPPEEIGLYPKGSSSTYKNEPQRRARFYEDAVRPVANLIEDGLSSLLTPGRRYDLDQHSSLYGGPHDRATYVMNIALAEKHAGQPFLTAQEKREILGFSGPAPPKPKQPEPMVAKPLPKEEEK